MIGSQDDQHGVNVGVGTHGLVPSTMFCRSCDHRCVKAVGHRNGAVRAVRPPMTGPAAKLTLPVPAAAARTCDAMDERSAGWS